MIENVCVHNWCRMTMHRLVRTYVPTYVCLYHDENVVFPSLVSSPPTGIKTVNVTATTITLSWQLPEHPGGRVHGYQVTVNGTVYDTLPWQHTLRVTNLTPGSEYTIVIQALNGIGGGEPSEVFVATLEPGKPVHLCMSVRMYVRAYIHTD